MNSPFPCPRYYFGAGGTLLSYNRLLSRSQLGDGSGCIKLKKEKRRSRSPILWRHSTVCASRPHARQGSLSNWANPEHSVARAWLTCLGPSLSWPALGNEKPSKFASKWLSRIFILVVPPASEISSHLNTALSTNIAFNTFLEKDNHTEFHWIQSPLNKEGSSVLKF